MILRAILLALLLPVAALAASPVAVLKVTGGNASESADSITDCKVPCLVYFEGYRSSDADLTDLDTRYTGNQNHKELTYHFYAGDSANDADNYTLANGAGDFRNVRKNAKSGGPVFSYVYYDAGTYTAILDVEDVDGNTNRDTASITVVDYTAAETVCVEDSSNSGFSGCPSGATQKTEGSAGYEDFDNAVNTALAAGNTQCNGATSACLQILFHGGQSYTANAVAAPAISKSYIGRYGTGLVTLSSSVTHTGIGDAVVAPVADDTRWCFFTMTAYAGILFEPLNDTNGSTAEGPGNSSNHLLCNFTAVTSIGSIANPNANNQGNTTSFVVPYNWGFFENTFPSCAVDAINNCYFGIVRKLSLVGNKAVHSDITGAEHLFRVNHYGSDSVNEGGAFIFANWMEGAEASNHTLTMRVANCSSYGGTTADDSTIYYGEFAVVASNKIVGKTQGTTQRHADPCGGQNTHSRLNVWEGNYFAFTATTLANPVNANTVQNTTNGLEENTVIRNNVWDARSDATNDNATFFNLTGECQDCWVLGNAWTTDDDSTDAQNLLENIGTGTDRRHIGNIGYPVSAATTTVVFEGGGGTGGDTVANNYQRSASTGTGVADITSYPFLNNPPTGSSSYQRDGGDANGIQNAIGTRPAGMMLDFNGNVRPLTNVDPGPFDDAAVAHSFSASASSSLSGASISGGSIN